MTRSAIVIGAGIGGLAAGLALKRAGWQIRILERAANPRELGFALLLAPNAMLALEALGLAQQVRRGGVVVTHGEMRRPNGDILRRFDTTRLDDTLGAPAVAVLRPVLHGVLLAAAGNDGLQLSSEVTGIEQGAESVEVTLANGTTVRADVAIGADGVSSVVRRYLHPAEAPPRDSGLLGVRGVAYDVVSQLKGSSGSQYFGRGIEAGLGRTSDTSVYWYLSVPAAALSHATTEPRAIVNACLGRFHESFRAIVTATRPDDMRVDRLVDRDPLPAWGRGRVTLLGDAAHPMLPHAGQGAAQAIEDAVALGQALSGDDVAEGLRRYESVRTKRTRQIVLLARRNARIGFLTNPVACWLRDTAIRLVPEPLILRSLIALSRPAAD